jgi:hypothetical protein
MTYTPKNIKNTPPSPPFRPGGKFSMQESIALDFAEKKFLGLLIRDFHLLYSSRSRVCRLTIGTATPWM